ncbi:unnamed protein product [Closterium sp. NIES-53]
MATQELRWLTYLLTDLGEAPRSPPVLYLALLFLTGLVTTCSSPLCLWGNGRRRRRRRRVKHTPATPYAPPPQTPPHTLSPPHPPAHGCTGSRSGCCRGQERLLLGRLLQGLLLLGRLRQGLLLGRLLQGLLPLGQLLLGRLLLGRLLQGLLLLGRLVGGVVVGEDRGREWHWGGGCETNQPPLLKWGGGEESKGVAGVPAPFLLYSCMQLRGDVRIIFLYLHVVLAVV